MMTHLGEIDLKELNKEQSTTFKSVLMLRSYCKEVAVLPNKEMNPGNKLAQ